MFPDFKKLKSEVSRRTLMQGIAGLSLGVGTTAPNFLSAASSSKPKKVVRIFLNSGISHLDSFDPKPQSPELMGDTKVIKTNTGEELSEYFPKLAQRMDKISLVRSMCSPEADHARAQYLNATSYPVLGTTKHPDFGAWMQRLAGSQNEALPSSVSIGGKGSGGYLGTDFDPFYISSPNDPLKGLMMENPTSDESLELLKLMADVRKKFHKENRIEHVESYRAFYNDSIKFMQSKDLDAFDLKKEDEATKKKFAIPHGERFLLARRLLEADVQFISIGIGGWDDHFDLWESFPEKANNLDAALALFIDDLYERGLFEDTILTVTSDFGRSPKITEGGRNHHRRAFTSIIAGAGIKNGIIYGKSDDQGMKVAENTVAPSDFNATLAAAAGLNTEKEIFSPDNRPFTIARGGEVVKDLLA